MSTRRPITPKLIHRLSDDELADLAEQTALDDALRELKAREETG